MKNKINEEFATKVTIDLSDKLDKVSPMMAEIQVEEEEITFTPQLDMMPMESLKGGMGEVGVSHIGGATQSELDYYTSLYLSGARATRGWNKEQSRDRGSLLNNGRFY